MKHQILAPCYLKISEMLTELEKMTFQRWGIAMLQDSLQAYRVKNKISELRTLLTSARDQIDKKQQELANQQGGLFTKKKEIKEEWDKKLTLKKEKELRLSHYTERRSEIDVARRYIDSDIYDLKREIRDLDREKDRLLREVCDLRNEIRSLEGSISSKRDKIRSNENAKGWLIAGAVASGIASIFTFGATAPLAIAATTAAIGTQVEINDLRDSISSCNSSRNSKEYQVRSINNSLDSKRGTVQNKESSLRDKRTELDRIEDKIREIQNECCLIQREIINIETELEKWNGEIATLQKNITELADLDKLVKGFIFQVEGMKNIAIAMDKDSMLCLSLKNIAKCLGEFEMSANSLENPPQMAMCPQYSLEYHEMKRRLEDFTKRADFASKKGIK